MVDIHSHILPYIDDGADSLESALFMATQAVQSNVTHMLASSHGNYYEYSLEEYRMQFERFRAELQRRDISLKLYPGMEIFVDSQTKDLLKNKKVLTINNTDNILIEFPFEESSGNVCRRIAELQKMGYNIILAHPERYIFIQRDPELAYYLESEGCVLQLNKGSILGQFGTTAQRLSDQMMRDGIAGVIASDTHDTRYRTPSMRNLVSMLRKNYRETEIRIWLSENPSRILKGYPTIRLKGDSEKE